MMKKIFLLAFIVLSLGSCKKFLEEVSQSDLTPETTKDYSELLYGDGYPLSDKFLQPFIRFMDDDLECYNRLPDIGGSANEMNFGAYTWQPDFIEVCREDGSSDVASFNSWKNYYSLILGCNVALQYVDNSVGMESEKRYLKGQALVLRAYYYFMLVNLYGTPYNDTQNAPESSLGVPLKLNANLSHDLPARNTVEEVYQQILEDLMAAIDLLEADKIVTTKYRINYIIAHHFASRVYLMMENWNKVIEHSSKVIAERPQLNNLHTWNNLDKLIVGVDNNPEVLWAFGHMKENEAQGVEVGYGASTELTDMFEPADLRLLSYVQILPEFLWPFFSIPTFSLKLNVRTELKERGYVWRTSETYLNRAEAFLQLYKTSGDDTQAQKGIDDLMTLRNMRIAGATPWMVESADLLLQKCRDERRRELCNEEAFRWFDLRRYGMPEIQHVFRPGSGVAQVYTLEARDPQYTLPIPMEAMNLNTNLIQNKQLPVIRQGQ